MNRRILCLALLAVAAPASADHNGMPVWPPVTNVLPVAGAGTGGAACASQSVSAPPATVTQDLRDGRTSGTVAATGSTACASLVPVKITMTIAIYEDDGLGRLDLRTARAAEVAAMRLMTANTCAGTIPGSGAPVVLGCSTKDVAFDLTPGSRYVAVSGTTYELMDPRGGAWILTAPPGCREGSVRAKMYCFVAAEFRA